MSIAQSLNLRNYLGLVRFSHTLFAMPFALASMVWAADGLPTLRAFLLIVLCMVTCRNAAMAFNRLIDADIDRENPRTARRHLPAGILSRTQVLGFLLLNAIVFVGATWFVNPLAFALSLPTLLAVCGYSITKRFTSLSHFFLGLAIGISPVGAWIAVRGAFAWEPILLCLALLLWIAGFDIIYATQDHEFDRSKGLHSMVVRLGVKGALWVSKLSHLAMWVVLGGLGWYGGLGVAYWVSLVLVAAMLAYLHLYRRSASLDSMNQDFFLANIAVSFCVMLGIGASFF
ncbi:MAG: putative 4-hydroxybenzoate polyprenyltransferase [Fibrobacteres bacterium]|nr:putative 4-hydroxybenzoate polyprenyltransferase [Fibrobacterota bacterium]